MKALDAAVFLTFSWTTLWFYPDQQGQRLYHKDNYDGAAAAFQDPLWKGVALYQARDFEAAAQAFARVDTAEGHFNQGNAWVFRGQYEQAVKSYDKALEKRPGWKEAEENRAIAQLRAERLETEGGDMTDGQLPPDEIVFDENKTQNEDSEETEVAGSQSLSDAEIQALWLHKVQTRPADFLKAKFAYQNAQKSTGGEE